MNAAPRPAVSVIVPVFNVERYLPECLDSLLAQTLDDFEVVVVNDGSTDGSQSVIDRYALAHPERMRCFEKRNGGLGDARNFGIEHARGAYLSFVDADDTVAPTMLEEMLTRARATGADLVLCGIRQFTDEDGSEPYRAEPDMSVFGCSLAEEPRLLFRVDASACDKLYERDLFSDPAVRFPVGLAFEDVPVVYRVLAGSRRVEKIDVPLYNYRRHRVDSISSAYGLRYLDLIEAFRMLDDFYGSAGFLEANRAGLLRLHLTHLIAGRYPDLFMRADAGSRRSFIHAAFGLLDAYFEGWRHSEVCGDLWDHPILRAVSTQSWLLDAFCRLPGRAYLGLLSRMRAFDPTR